MVGRGLECEVPVLVDGAWSREGTTALMTREGKELIQIRKGKLIRLQEGPLAVPLNNSRGE